MYLMRITRKEQVEQWANEYPDAATSLRRWYSIARMAQWQSITDLRRNFPHADMVKTGKGKVATVFNIAGNKYRLIAAIHYNARRIYTLRFLTHAQYDKDTWKDEL